MSRGLGDVYKRQVEDAVRELDAIITAEHCKPKERMSVLAE